MTFAEIIESLHRVRALGIASEVAAQHCITLAELLGDERKEDYVRARVLLYRSLHYVRGISYPRLAELLDRDHTSILNLVQDDGVRAAKNKARAKRARLAKCLP